jgi:tetratricopeptide (TPR) repeat protein
MALIVPVLGQEPRTQSGSDTSSAQNSPDAALQAAYELNACARSYKAGNFVEAQKHAERALELDPTQKNAPLFIARSIHAQFRNGLLTPDNIVIARSAISAYQRILERWPDSDEAFNAIGFLYGAINENENQRDWVSRRAFDSSVSPEKRAEAYVFLASKDWDCSFRITENSENKYTTEANGQVTVHFKKPKNWEDFDRAMLCITKAMEEVEIAITLSPNYRYAWGYKTNILLEAGKLAEMEGKRQKAAGLRREADAAQKRTLELNRKYAEDNQPGNGAIIP